LERERIITIPVGLHTLPTLHGGQRCPTAPITNKKDKMKSKKIRKGVLLEVSPAQLKELDPNPNNRIDGVHKKVHEGRLRVLKRNIEKYGFKKAFPIVLDKDFVICDGHHRVAACIALNKNAYVLVDEEATVEQYAQISASTQKWNINDFIKAAVNNGSQAAKIVEHFMEKFNFSASAIIRIEYGMHVRKSDIIELITSKKLAFRDIEETKSKLNHLRDCLQLLPEYNEKIIGALSLLMQHDRYDENVMIRKLKQVGGNLKPSSSQKHYTEQFQRFYNHGTRSRRIYFL
tara:strand:- start:17 stop:883 length:867 start_codon:yes stop_codon:yes gene_type:complete